MRTPNLQNNTISGSVISGSVISGSVGDKNQGIAIGQEITQNITNIIIGSDGFFEYLQAQEISSEPWDGFAWREAAERYRQKLLKLYGKVPVIGRGELKLENIFTDVYILDKPLAYLRHNIRALQEEGVDYFRLAHDTRIRSQKRYDGLALVGSGKNLYILGKPGAGKTTFLRHVAVHYAQRNPGILPDTDRDVADRDVADRDAHATLPIFISLHAWSLGNQPTLFDFIVQQFDVCGFPDAAPFVEYVLAAGQAVLLFDGLDEVRQQEGTREALINQLRRFIDKYDRSQHLITCRVAADEYRFAGFADVEVADFTQDQVLAYGEKWFGVGSIKATEFASAIQSHVNQAVRELCNTPLLLSLVCIYFDENMTFPQWRADLYEDALTTLLKKWDARRNIRRDEIYKNLSHRRRQQLLSHIATPAFEKGQYFFTTRELADTIASYLSRLPQANVTDPDDIDGEGVLEAIAAHHGLLVERAVGIYSFSHLTFHEYFTAKYIVEHKERGTLTSLARHSHKRHWREVFLLVATLLDEADDMAVAMLDAAGQLIADRSVLVEMCAWSGARTKVAHHDGSQYAVRLAYIYLYRFLGSESDRDSTRNQASTLDLATEKASALNLALASALNLALASASALTHARNLALARALNLALASESALNLASSSTLAKDIVKKVGKPVSFDYALYYTWSISVNFGQSQYLDDKYSKQRATFANAYPAVVDFCDDVGETALSLALRGLDIPDANSPQAAWQRLADELATLMQTHRDFRFDWVLEREDVDRFNEYLDANELLVQCLKLASVTDREGIMERLFLPPA